MSKEETIIGCIRRLEWSESWYTVSPYHRQYGEETEFYELEDYLLENYLGIFATKIVMIILKLICLYTAYIDIAEVYKKNHPALLGIEENTDIRGKGLQKIEQVIKSAIMEEGMGNVSVYFPEFDSLISIGCQFSVSVHTDEPEFLLSVRELVKMEGLSIWMVEDGGKPTYYFDEIG